MLREAELHLTLVRALPQEVHRLQARRVSHQRQATPRADHRLRLDRDAPRRRQPVPDRHVDRCERVTNNALQAFALPHPTARSPREARVRDTLDIAGCPSRHGRRRNHDLDPGGLPAAHNRDRQRRHIDIRLDLTRRRNIASAGPLVRESPRGIADTARRGVSVEELPRCCLECLARGGRRNDEDVIDVHPARESTALGRRGRAGLEPKPHGRRPRWGRERPDGANPIRAGGQQRRSLLRDAAAAHVPLRGDSSREARTRSHERRDRDRLPASDSDCRRRSNWPLRPGRHVDGQILRRLASVPAPRVSICADPHRGRSDLRPFPQ